LTGSTITGNLVYSGALTNTGSTISGTSTQPLPAQVVADFNTAYGQYAAIPCTGTLLSAYTGATLTLAPGVYCTDAAVTFTDTTLTLAGPSNGVWIFKIGTLGTGALTGTNLSVVMANGATACNVNWWVAQAATMTTSGFQGNILAGAAITATGLAGSTTPFNGDALAKAEVTLTDFTVTGCGATQPPPPSCDKDHRHHKHCNHRENDKPHCDGDDGDHDGHDKDGHHKDGHDKDDRDHKQEHHFWK
jgi:hypothetical protein